MQTIEIEGAPSLKSLDIAAQVIGMEALNSSQILQALPARLPAFVSDVKLFVSNMLHANDVKVLGAIESRRLEKELPKQNYVILSEVTVFVPPSVNVDWMTYLDAVNQSQAIVELLKEETLAPTLRWLSLLLSAPESLASLRSSLQVSGIKFHDLEKVKKQLQKCYSSNGADSEVPYGKAFKRNGDFLVCIKRVNELNDRLANINRSEIIDMVNEITAAMDKLLIRMKQNPEQYKVSGITMNDLSRIAFNLGHEIEFFSAHVFMVQSATQAMTDSKNKIEEIITR